MNINVHSATITLPQKFAQHLNEHIHSFGNIHDIVQVLQFQKEGTHLNTIECFYIHKEAASNNHLNNEYTVSLNRVFNTNLNILSKQ